MKRLFGFLLVGLLLVVIPVAAQDDGEAAPISYGETVTGELGEDNPAELYTFEGSAGDVVTITMATPDSDLDTVVNLYTSAGYDAGDDPIADNDDALDDTGLDSFDSRIPDFELPEDGTYIIQATRFSSFGEGSYELTLETGDDMAGDMDGAQTIALDEGASDISVIIPAGWVNEFEAPFTIVASDVGALEVFTAEDVIPAPAGELGIAITSPESLAEFAGEVDGDTPTAYLETLRGIFDIETEVTEYDGFSVPAVGVSLEAAEDVPPNTVMFAIELDAGIAWVLVVPGGVYSDFEPTVIEVVDSLAGIEPSFATEDMMDEEMDAAGGDITLNVPDDWVTSEVDIFDVAASSDAALEIFEADDGLPLPDGDIALAVASPAILSELAGQVSENTPAAYAEFLSQLFEVDNEIIDYQGFDFPAAQVSLDGGAGIPPNATIFTVELDAGIAWVIVVTGGEFSAFESQIVEIVNGLDG